MSIVSLPRKCGCNQQSICASIMLTNSPSMEHLHVTDQRLRLAIISPPRSGNSWLRMVIASAVQLHEIAIHYYLDAPAELPARCLLQIHWVHGTEFLARLAYSQDTSTTLSDPLANEAGFARLQN